MLSYMITFVNDRDNLLLFSLTILFIKVIRTASPILAKQSLFFYIVFAFALNFSP